MIKTVILKYGFVIAMITLANFAIADARAGHHLNIKLVTIDTTGAAIYKETSNVQKHALARLGAALEREKLLDKLSKVPSDFPEFFLNAKEEYLWREKIKIQTDANGRPLPQSEDQQTLHVKNGLGERPIPQ